MLLRLFTYAIPDIPLISLFQRLCNDSSLRALLSYLKFQTQLPYSTNGRTSETQRETINSVERHTVPLYRLIIIELARPTTRLTCSWNLNLTFTYTPRSLYTLTNCKLSQKNDNSHSYFLPTQQISLPYM